MQTVKVIMQQSMALPPGEAFREGDIVTAPKEVADNWVKSGIATYAEEPAQAADTKTETKFQKREKSQHRLHKYEAR